MASPMTFLNLSAGQRERKAVGSGLVALATGSESGKFADHPAGVADREHAGRDVAGHDAAGADSFINFGGIVMLKP